MISLRQLTLYRGGQPLLESVDLTIHRGQRVGLVGANGSGKSSLFSLLRGQLTADAGQVEMPPGQVIAHVAQETPALDRPALEYVLDGDAELRRVQAALQKAEADGDGTAIARLHGQLDAIDGYSAHARAGDLLNGLGFAPDQHKRSVRSFSGGWRVRLNLAQALMCRSDLLLLDEPTNHLDLEAVLWLEQWLCRYPGTLLLISHDRDFLDGVVNAIVHIEHRRLNYYAGNYSAFEEQRAARLAQQQSLYEKQQREIVHLQRFIDRFRAKATKARAAQSRVKALDRMERIAPAHIDSPFRFAFREAPKASNPLIAMRDADLGYANQTILKGVRLNLAPGARIGLLGPNGAGKSTLVKCLAGEVRPSAGEIVTGDGLRVGYFAQHQLEQLDAAASPLLHLQRLDSDAEEQRLRDFIGGFGFSGDQMDSQVAPFSGGEKARLVLALTVWQRPNLLLLDEPTNHLDLEMRHALVLALQDFQGAMVLVSHDRHLLATSVDDYLLVAEGRVRDFSGDLTDYQDWLRQRDQAKAPPARVEGGHTADARKEQRRAEAARRQAAAPLKKRVDKLDRELEALAGDLSEVESRLTEPELYEPQAKDRLTALLQRQGDIKRRQEAVEAEWLEAQEALEQTMG